MFYCGILWKQKKGKISIILEGIIAKIIWFQYQFADGRLCNCIPRKQSNQIKIIEINLGFEKLQEIILIYKLINFI